MLGANSVKASDDDTGNEFKITIKTLTGMTGLIKATQNTTIGGVKTLIADLALGVSVENQRLVCRGKQLEGDFNTLADYNIYGDVTIHMVVKQVENPMETTSPLPAYTEPIMQPGMDEMDMNEMNMNEMDMMDMGDEDYNETPQTGYTYGQKGAAIGGLVVIIAGGTCIVIRGGGDEEQTVPSKETTHIEHNGDKPNLMEEGATTTTTPQTPDTQQTPR